MSSTLNTKVIALLAPKLKALKQHNLLSAVIKAALLGSIVSALLLSLYFMFWPNSGANDSRLNILAPILGESNSLTLSASLLLWLALTACISAALGMYLYTKRCTPSSAKDFLLHLNRTYPSLEESAHFALYSHQQLSIMQRMQLQRISSALITLLESPEPVLQLLNKKRKPPYYLLFTALVCAGLLSIVILTKHHTPIKTVTGTNQQASEKAVVNYLPQLAISVKAPAYTQQVAFEQDELNINALQGSRIEWFIPFTNNQNNAKFELSLSSGEVLPFEKKAQGYSLVYLANASAIYSIAQVNATMSFTTDIATLAVTLDAKPRINIKTPLLTITELAKNTSPKISTVVEVVDDYGLSNVNIVASIAKGSGEAVKFRDETFSFDSHSQDQNVHLYKKQWDLTTLDMSPGDELYFSVHASDNKTPTAQTSISPTKIVRWLEDEEEGMASEGILIDFMPDYFKSQRQIIIETEALIEQQQNISEEEFKQTSRALAIDQSSLKQSYGQYLGDEFESGVMHTMEAGPTIVMTEADDHDDDHDDHESHDEHDEHDEQNNPSTEHTHAHEDTPSNSFDEANDLSGYQETIALFGHNHGEADIGFIKTSPGQINPKVLMKRALGEMWQAELHLQLASPLAALPYEKQALAYLNRAKQAERIYVKRLGFEPPPVSEERRYQGKLSDILSYNRSTQVQVPVDINQQVSAFMFIANRAITLQPATLQPPISQTPTSQEFNPRLLSIEERQIVDELAQLLNERIQQSPEWITQLATIKRIQVANSFTLKDCKNCLNSLITEVSILLSAPISPPLLRNSTLSSEHKAVDAYSEALLQLAPEQKLKTSFHKEVN